VQLREDRGLEFHFCAFLKLLKLFGVVSLPKVLQAQPHSLLQTTPTTAARHVSSCRTIGTRTMVEHDVPWQLVAIK
jgi:hypothetical protein